MAGRMEDKKIPRCSFCNKTQDQVRKLIAGPNGVYICDECVDICADIIEEEYENVLGFVQRLSPKNLKWRRIFPRTFI